MPAPKGYFYLSPQLLPIEIKQKKDKLGIRWIDAILAGLEVYKKMNEKKNRGKDV